MALCACPPAAEASNVDDSLVVGIHSVKTPLIRPLDPTERDMVSFYELIYESLVTIDDDYMPAPGLCESWDISPDGRTWTFRLRENVCFSDGTPLTAADVVATAEYIIGRANDEASSDKGYYRNLALFISRITANGERTVTVKAAAGRRYYGLLYAMTFPVLKASEVDAIQPTGSGPYVITGYQPGQYLWLEANENWWRSQPQVKHITAVILETEKQVIESYQYARVDAIFTRSISASQYSTGTTTLVMSTRTNQLETLLINNGQFPLDDVNIRQAIRYAVDADKLAANAYNGMVIRTDTPVIPGTWLYNDGLGSWFQHSLAEAARLLEEAGWVDLDDDGVRDKPKADGSGNYRLHLRLLVYEEPDNDVRVEAANQVSEWLAEIGVEAKVEILTMVGMQERLKAGSFDLAFASFAMDPVPDPGFLLMNRNTGDYSRYRSQSMTELFNDLRTRTNRAEYQNVLWQIQQKFAQECPFICLYWRKGAVLSRKMYTTNRDMRELELLRGIEEFKSR